MTSSSAVYPPIQEGLLTHTHSGLLGGGCASCGRSHFPLRPVCPDCQSADVAARPLSNEGTIYTFTIVQMPPPGYVGETPYALGIVELPERLRVTTTLTADSLDDLAIGDSVRFELLTLTNPDGDPVSSFAFRKEST
jgi:hypothetical protein